MTTARDSLLSAHYEYSAGRSYLTLLGDGIRDLRQGAQLFETWGPLAWRDLKHQTHRTLLGPLWSIVGTGIQVAALGYVYGALFQNDPTEGYPYIAAGLILWFFISSTIMGGLSVFQGGAGVIKERSLPLSFTVFRYTSRMFAELCYKFVVFAIVAVLASLPPSWNMLLTLPGLALFLLNGLWVVLLFGVIGARYRDVLELVGPLMLIAFLASPVMWHARHVASRSFLTDYNPLTHYLAIVRDPLLGQVPEPASILVVLTLTVAGWISAVLAFSWARNRIVFWL